LTQTFVGSCVDFEAAHLWFGHKELCSPSHTACMRRNTVVLGLNLKAQVIWQLIFAWCMCCLRIMEE